jgi:hypothetical protein
MWSCIRRSQSADNNESSSVSLSRYRRTSNDNKPSFDGGIKQKNRRPEAGRSVSSTDANARDIQNPPPQQIQRNLKTTIDAKIQKTNITKTLITAFAGIMAYIWTITGDQPWRQQKQRLME